MRILTRTKLSQHKYKTPEGYLVCVDSILSRTGKQQYRRSEVWGDSCDRPEEIVDIDRTSNEVFSDAALASFENKPLTIDHPGVEVNPDNHRELSVGFVRDIKKGVVDGQEVMLGTLVVTDSEAIRLIEDGTYTDLSCGYDCDIEDEENPTQKNIRGNHVALCEEGRAGIAKIVDSVNDKIDEDKKDHIIKYFKIWGKPGPAQLQEVVNFYRIDRKNGIEIFKALGGYDMDQVEKLKFYDNKVEDGPLWKLPMRNLDQEEDNETFATVKEYGLMIQQKDAYNYIIMGTKDKLEKYIRNEFAPSFVNKRLAEMKPITDSVNDADNVYEVRVTSDQNWAGVGKARTDVVYLVNAKNEDEAINKVRAQEGGDGYVAKLKKPSALELAFMKRRGRYLDAYEQMKMPKKDKDFIKNYLRMISTFTSRDTDISDVLRPLYGHGYKCVIEKIDDWHDPKGAYAYKNYTVSFENYIDRFNVTLYADPNQDWKVKEVNAYFLDSNIVEDDADVEKLKKMIKREQEIKQFILKNGFEKSMHLKAEYHALTKEIGQLAQKIDGQNAIYGPGILTKLHKELGIHDSTIYDGPNRYVLAKRKNAYDEYVVRAYRNGKYYEDATYYTDDWDDAVGTLKEIARQENLIVKQTATGYVAE